MLESPDLQFTREHRLADDPAADDEQNFRIDVVLFEKSGFFIEPTAAPAVR